MLQLQAWLVRRSVVDAHRHAAHTLRTAWTLRKYALSHCLPTSQHLNRALYSCVCSTTTEQPAPISPPGVASPLPHPTTFSPAKPGTVKLYDYHFFIRNPTRMAGAALDYNVLWPPAVERYALGTLAVLVGCWEHTAAALYQCMHPRTHTCSAPPPVSPTHTHTHSAPPPASPTHPHILSTTPSITPAPLIPPPQSQILQAPCVCRVVQGHCQSPTAG